MRVKHAFDLLLRWFTRYLVLFLAAAFALVMISGRGTSSLGLPAVFWCRPWIIGYLAVGASVATFFALCSFVGFLLDHDKPEVSLTPDRAGMEEYFHRTYWLPTLIVFARGIIGQFFYDESCGREWLVLLGYVLGVVWMRFAGPRLMPLATRIANAPRFRWFVDWLRGKSRQKQLAANELWLHAYAFVVIVLIGLLYLLSAILIEQIPINAAVAICVILSLIVLGYGALRFFVPRVIPLFVVALACWIFGVNQLPEKHRYEELKDTPTLSLARYARITSHGLKSRNPNLVREADAFAGWQKQAAVAMKRCKSTDAKPKLVIVMTSGGGIRAAVWTDAVLQELSDKLCGFDEHVRVITGASGGMVGAGAYVAARAQGKRADVTQVQKDALDSVAKYLALHDAPGLLVPWHVRDRGFALEERWKENILGFDQSFDELRAKEKLGEIPSLIYAPTLLDDGRILLISNLQLGYMTRHLVRQVKSDLNHVAAGLDVMSYPAVQFYELFPRVHPSLATVARMSASFPWVSPASELPTRPLRRVGDAGYFDAYGGYVAAVWLAENRAWLLANTSGVLLIHVRDKVIAAENRNVGSPSSPWNRGASEFVAPIQGALKTRGAVMNYRTDAALAYLGADFGTHLKMLEIELPDEVAPLSWNLTENAAKNIVRHVEQPTALPLCELTAWWTNSRVECPAARTAPTP